MKMIFKFLRGFALGQYVAKSNRLTRQRMAPCPCARRDVDSAQTRKRSIQGQKLDSYRTGLILFLCWESRRAANSPDRNIRPTIHCLAAAGCPVLDGRPRVLNYSKRLLPKMARYYRRLVLYVTSETTTAAVAIKTGG